LSDRRESKQLQRQHRQLVDASVHHSGVVRPLAPRLIAALYRSFIARTSRVLPPPRSRRSHGAPCLVWCFFTGMKEAVTVPNANGSERLSYSADRFTSLIRVNRARD